MQVIIFALNGAADDITTYGSGRCVALQNSLLRVRRITNHQSLKSDTHNITPDSAARCSPVACAGGNAVRAHTKGGDTCFLTGGGHLGGPGHLLPGRGGILRGGHLAPGGGGCLFQRVTSSNRYCIMNMNSLDTFLS